MPMPIRDFSAANPSVTAVNDAKRFLPFDPARLNWLGSNSNEDAAPAMNATGLGLHLTAKPGASPVVLAASMGLMSCAPTMSETGDIAVQRLQIHLSPEDLGRLQGSRDDGLDYFDVDDARFVYEMKGALVGRLTSTLSEHFANHRLLSFGNPQVSVRWSTGPTRPTGVDFFDGNAESEAFYAWLTGRNALRRYFADGVDQTAAVLLQMQPGGSEETLTLHAEVRRYLSDDPDGGWYRVNPGFVLDRLRGANEAREAYVALSGGCIARGIASGGRATARMDLCALAGGTVAWPWDPESPDTTSTVVLQPRGVVPPALFSFITCDEVRVFAARLAMNITFRLTCAEPTITPAALREAWPAAGKANHPFRAVDYPSAGVGAPPQNQRFYDALDRVVTYPSASRFIGTVRGTNLPPNDEPTWRALIPQENSFNRPLHPRWREDKVEKGRQLRRLYPLRYYVRINVDDPTSPEFGMQQDPIDCARQEYVCHFNWVNEAPVGYYYQPSLPTRFTRLMRPSNFHSRLDGDGNPRLEPGTLKEVPAVESSSGRIIVPARTDFRGFSDEELERDDVPATVRPDRRARLTFESDESLSPFFPVTHMHRDLMPRLTQVREGTHERAMAIKEILEEPTPTARAAAIDDALQGGRLTPFLGLILREVLVTIPGSSAESVDTTPGFLYHMFTPGAWDFSSVSHPLKDYILDAPARFSDRLTAAGDGARTDDEVRKRLVLASSTWRGPEHNETISTTIASNHQVGLALDLKPTASGPTTRNPLFLTAIHDLGQEAKRQVLLKELLLELGSDSYVLGVFDPTKIDHRIVPDGPPDPAGRPFAELDPDDNHVPLVSTPDMEKPGADGITSLILAQTFDRQYNQRPAGNGLDWPAELPTYLQMYVFGLLHASHVHFTFIENVALP